MMDEVDVAIVGAGPTGLMLAAELTRRGVSVLLAERSSGPSVHSKALAVHARTLDMFSTLGAARPFLEHGVQLQRIRIFSSGKEHAVLPLDEIDSPFPFVLSLPQSETERLLLARLREFGGRVAWESEVTRVSAADSHAELQVATPRGETREVKSRWLVGCDGARSMVRTSMNIEWSGEDIDLHFAFADLHLETEVLARDAFQVFLLDDSTLIGVIPLPGDDLYRVIHTLSAQQLEVTKDVDFFRELLQREVESKLSVRQAVWFSEFTIRQRIAAVYRKGSVFLAGDAAHAHSPAGGQGMNTGLQDAHNLAWKLAAVVRGQTGEALLDSYEAERRPIAARVITMTGAGTQAVGHLPAWKRALRDIALSVLPRLPPVRRRMLDILSQESVDYADSPIVYDELGRGAGELRAGTFAPDLELGDGGRLHDILGDGYVILSTDELPDVRRGRRVHVPWRTLSDAGVSHSDAVFVIRPDGYVGYAGRSHSDRFRAFIEDAVF